MVVREQARGLGEAGCCLARRLPGLVRDPPLPAPLPPSLTSSFNPRPSHRSQDNIKEEELLQYIEQVLRLPLYDRDTGRTNGQQQQQPPPQQLPPPQQQQQQQQQDGAP